MLKDIDVVYLKEQLEISINVIKTIFVVLCTYYTNFKITNKKLQLNFKIIYDIIIAIIVGIICSIIRYKISYLTSIVLEILMLSIIFSKDKIINGIFTTVISLAINYIILTISIIIAFIVNIIMKFDNSYINLSIIIISHLIILYNIFKIRRLKHGFSFLQKNIQNEYLDILILNISAIILFSIIILVNSDLSMIKNIGAGLIIYIIIMFITIQKSLQLYYKQKLLEQVLEKTKNKLEEKTKEVEELEKENIKISKKNHTLSHKQKSLEYKLDEVLNKTEISKEEVGELTDRIEKIRKELYKEKIATELSKTGIPQIDDMLKYMQSECKKNKIDFELQLKGNIHYMTKNLITKEDLETLLADHIKNAIIAINHTDNINRSILVRLGEIDGIYSLYIYDSGIEFEKETLENLGKKPSTTHVNEGGTGMGFMNTFDTLKNCKASLTIEEISEPNKDNYTKVIIIKFDNKNEFKINSYKTGNNIIDTRK